MHILWWSILGLLAGWMTGKITKGFGYGTWIDVVMGIAGAVTGGFIMRSLGFSGQRGMVYTMLVAILGAVILTAFIAVASGRKRYA